jgi:hypothetical protein
VGRGEIAPAGVARLAAATGRLIHYMHVWHSRTDGVLEIRYRVDGQKTFSKLYLGRPRQRALIQVPPHPTLSTTTRTAPLAKTGSPGSNSRGLLRANTRS